MSEDTVSTATNPKPKARVRFVRCFLIAVTIIALPTSGVVYFNIYLPHGKGPAGPDVPSEPFRHIWSEQKVLLLGIGDSVTDGFGARAGFSYFDRLIKNPAGDSQDMLGKNLSVVFPKLEAKNIAVSGSNSFSHINKILTLQPQSPDVLGMVVITTGGNDLIHNYGRKPPKEGAIYGATFEQARPWIDNFQKRLDEMIPRLKEKFPGGCHIFLANIYDPSDGTGDTIAWLTGLPAWPDGVKILEAYNKILADCDTKYEYVHLVDIHTTFLGHGIHCRKFWIKNYRWGDPTYWYYLNIEDPSERGYDAVRRLFLNEMVKVFYDAKNEHKAN
jgi:lysophospholipase L1-like esterase